MASAVSAETSNNNNENVKLATSTDVSRSTQYCTIPTGIPMYIIGQDPNIVVPFCPSAQAKEDPKQDKSTFNQKLIFKDNADGPSGTTGSDYLLESNIIYSLTTQKCKDLLNVYGVQGIEYVITEKPKICRNFIKKTYNVKKESEEMKTGNIQEKSSSSTNIQLGCFAYGYVGLEVSSDTSASQNSIRRRNKNKKSSNEIAKTVIACEIARFDCSAVWFQSDALKMLEQIGRTKDTSDQKRMAMEFLRKYPAEEIIYTSFAVGGWFSHFAKETSAEDYDESKEIKSESAQVNSSVNANVSYNMAFKSNNTVGYQNTQSNDNSEESKTRNYLVERNKNITYAGPLANSEMGILQGCLKNTNNWAVFPTLTGQQHNTKSVVEIILETANKPEEKKRKEFLETAARAIGEIIKNSEQERTLMNTKHKYESIRSMDSLFFYTENERFMGKPIFQFSWTTIRKISVGRKATVSSKYRIYKFQGNKGDPICHRDIVMIQLANSSHCGENLLYRRKSHSQSIGHRDLTLEKLKSGETYRFCWIIEGIKDELVSYKHRICLRAVTKEEFSKALNTKSVEERTKKIQCQNIDEECKSANEVINSTDKACKSTDEVCESANEEHSNTNEDSKIPEKEYNDGSSYGIGLFSKKSKSSTGKRESEDVLVGDAFYICKTSSGKVKLLSEQKFPFIQYNKGWNVMKENKNDI